MLVDYSKTTRSNQFFFLFELIYDCNQANFNTRHSSLIEQSCFIVKRFLSQFVCLQFHIVILLVSKFITIILSLNMYF